MKEYIKLYSNCIPVKGFSRSIIVDLLYNKYHFIPNDLYNILTKSNEVNFYNNECYSVIDRDTIQEYFDFLYKERLVFNTTTPNLFNEINKEWQYPSLITNLVVTDLDINFFASKIINEIEYLNIKGLQLVYLKTESTDILTLLDKLKNSRLQSITIALDYKYFANYDFKKFVLSNFRVFEIQLYNSPSNKLVYLDENNVYKVNYYKFPYSCGSIHPGYFIINQNFVFESMNFNNCLNRKLAIMGNGDIKNCPFINKAFGNVYSKRLREIVKNDMSTELWKIRKDEVVVCKDCEFRLICSDCRVLVKDCNNIYSQPAKCTYNPYIAKWKGQDGYITVDEWKQKQTNTK